MSDPSIDEILAQAENPAFLRVSTAKVLLRQDLVTRHAELEAELKAAIARDADHNDNPRAPVISRQITDLEAEMEAAKVEFKFRNIGKKAWADLLKDHPPTKEQIEAEADAAKQVGRRARAIDHNLETFPIAAIAAASVTPVMDEAAVRRLEAALTDSQFTSLWEAAIDANIGGAHLPKSMAAGQILRANGRYATSASAVDDPYVEASS